VYVALFPRGRRTGLRRQADRFDLKEKIIVHKKSSIRITGTKSEQITVKNGRPITTSSGVSTIVGKMTISRGRVKADKLIIR
jgi:hypothetical protein